MFPSLFGKTDSVLRDANRLMDKMGDQAFSVAGELAWREDAGLLVVKRPGHWRFVQSEIGKRTGQTLPKTSLSVNRQTASDPTMSGKP